MLTRIAEIAVLITVTVLIMFLLIYPAPTRADNTPPIVLAVQAAVQEMTGVEISPEYVMMTGDEIKFDACVYPGRCPNYVSVHPPMTNKILVTTDIDIAKDLSAQMQLAHVLTMFAYEKSGKYSPDMACKEVFALEQMANQIATAYVLAVQHEYELANKTPPMFGNPQVLNICSWGPKPKPPIELYI